MMLNLKNIVTVAFLGLVGWFGLHTYNYFFDINSPSITIIGLADGGYYAGDVQWVISANKAGVASVWLDDKPLQSKFNIRAGDCDYPFTIPTKELAGGEHSFRVKCTDNTFHKNQSFVERTFHVDNVPLQAAFIRPDTANKVMQGRTLHVQFQVNKDIKNAQVRILGQELPCFPESKGSPFYECFVPVPCEEKSGEQLLTAEIVDKVGNKVTLNNSFEVAAYPFKRQVVHISKEKLEEEKEIGLDPKLLAQELERIAQNSPQEKLWCGTFCTPIDIVRTTCEFGTIRTTQHKGRYAHKAVDVINTPKSVVWAPQEGVVALKERYASSGNTVVIDHGHGVVSMFYHLDDFANIDVGQKVAQGNPIGTIGKTGHATGYHLHWEMRVNNVAVDPMQWTKPTF